MAYLQQNPLALNPNTFNDRLPWVANKVEEILDHILPPPTTRLHEAMRYSVLGGGKRIRSYLLYESSLLFDVESELALGVCAAIEMIQSYSLVHDDLPCMDNADLRRGKPSCHIAFGETTATLVGDALVPLAYETICKLNISAEVKLSLVSALSQTIGSQGLVGGQMMDLCLETPIETYENILEVERLKTGVFFGFAAEAGAILGEATKAEKNSLGSYGLLIGEAFQMRDDLLDGIGTTEALGKPSSQDTSKLTFFSLLGHDRLSKRVEEASYNAIKQLEDFGDKAIYLRDLAHYGLQRVR